MAGDGRPVIVVDGSNVAHDETGGNSKPRVDNIELVRQALKERGYDPIVVTDAALWHQVDDPDRLDALIDDHEVRQAPADTDADYFILELADRFDARVVSNDRFDDYSDRHPWVEDRRVPFMIVRGEVQFHKLGSAHPA